MGRSNYKLTANQKQILDDLADDIIVEIENGVSLEDKCLDVYNTPDGTLDRNMLTAIVWYIGDKLSHY